MRMYISLVCIALSVPGAWAAAPTIESDGENLVLKAQEVTLEIGSDSPVNIAGVLARLQDANGALTSRLDQVDKDAAAAADHSKQVQDTLTGLLAWKTNALDQIKQLQDEKKALAAKVATLEEAEAARVVEEAQEDKDEDTQAVVLAALGNRVDVADAALNATGSRLQNLIASAADEFDSLDALVDWLYTDYTSQQSFTELIANGRCENSDGRMADVSDVGTVQTAYGDRPKQDMPGDPPFSMVDITKDEGPTPMLDGKAIKYAFQFSVEGEKDVDLTDYTAQLLIERSAEHKRNHPTMCPGSYRLSVWAKYSRDYDGWRMLLHHRFFGANGDNVGDWAHNSSPAGGDGIMERGFWPSKPDEWQECSITIKLRKPATTMYWYLGYPLKSTAGSLSFTGMSMVRLGGDGSC